jgi:hypothetical protein
LPVEDRIQSLYRRAKREDLVVLVWGPGDPGAAGSPELQKYWQKRQKIRDSLADVFKSSEILFSESGSLRDHTRDLQNLLTEELVHAAAADCILVLDVSRGAHVEVDRLSGYAVIAQKIRVLIPDRYVGSSGLVKVIHDKLAVVGFSEDEFTDCRLATDKCVKLVLSVAIEKMMKLGGIPAY